MTQKMTSQQNVLNALGIDSFRQFPKEKVNAFISLIPSMDRELSIECIKQFPNFVELATEAITKLNGLCDTAIKEAGNSQRESIEAYKIILTGLSELLNSDNISSEERQWIVEQMVDVADKIAAKDSEHKARIENIIKHGICATGFVVILSLSVLGVKAASTKLPSLKN